MATLHVAPSPLPPPLLIHSYLSAPALGQLQRAFQSPHVVSIARSWDALVAHVRERRCDVAVVDPCEGAEHLLAERLHSLASSNAHASATAIVGYVSVSAAGIRAVQGLIQLGASEIVVRGVDDSAFGLAAAVNRAVAACSAAHVVFGVGFSFEALPAPVAVALKSMFQHPQRVRSVGDLAAAANTTRRSLDRTLARAGLASARTLLSCARANAAFHLLSDGRAGKAQAVSLVGYASARSLARELYAITGCRASAIPNSLSRDDFTAVLHRRLLRESPAATSASY